MRKVKKIYILFAALCLCFISCGRKTAPTEKITALKVPSNPIPLVNAVDIQPDVLLAWSAAIGEDVTFDLYFSEESPPSLLESSLPDTTFLKQGLKFNTTYYWKVVTKNVSGSEKTSPIWSFTTEESLEIIEQAFQLGNTNEFIEMIWVNPGSYLMGASAADEIAEHDEKPQHTVNIIKGFWLGKYEITCQQWAAVVGEPYERDTLDLPQGGVSWEEIHLRFLSDLNRNKDVPLWRLPSEAEWEYAGRAGSLTHFAWGDNDDYSQMINYAWFGGNADHRVHGVGEKYPNAWGFYDMQGNLWEWCEDDWHDGYRQAPTTGRPWIDQPDRRPGRSLRGGSAYETVMDCRITNRRALGPTNDMSDLGFRLVMEESNP